MTDRRSAEAEGWLGVALRLETSGRRDRALVAARTAMALLERAEDADRLGADRLDHARAEVGRLTGPDVVPMHVDVAAGEHDPAAQARAERRAVWLGAPVEAVLAMLGWVEHDGVLEVVRVVVPGTRRGRSAFATLLGALPDVGEVGLRLPARDPHLVRLASRHGFEVLPGAPERTGHVGGSVRLRRDAAVPGAVGFGPSAAAGERR
ncbi:hypothetical protein [Jannaschia sp. R86511]|uniref:hypothetical protein n=1 Tax=Jannaschia sp. R86511 TaxID=3093853 RepID=UPI0036D3C26D